MRRNPMKDKRMSAKSKPIQPATATTIPRIRKMIPIIIAKDIGFKPIINDEKLSFSKVSKLGSLLKINPNLLILIAL